MPAVVNEMSSRWPSVTLRPVRKTCSLAVAHVRLVKGRDNSYYTELSNWDINNRMLIASKSHESVQSVFITIRILSTSIRPYCFSSEPGYKERMLQISTSSINAIYRLKGDDLSPVSLLQQLAPDNMMSYLFFPKTGKCTLFS